MAKKDSWQTRVERVLKLSLETQRDILKAITGGSLESRVTIHPGTPKFYDQATLHHDSHHHHHGHKNHN